MAKAITGEYKASYEPTLGVDAGSKSMENSNGSTTTLTFWDFSGKLDFV